jgi:hypothetical protein
MAKQRHRGFCAIKRLLYDRVRYMAYTTFTLTADAEAWLANERAYNERAPPNKWLPPKTRDSFYLTKRDGVLTLESNAEQLLTPMSDIESVLTVIFVTVDKGSYVEVALTDLVQSPLNPQNRIVGDWRVLSKFQ